MDFHICSAWHLFTLILVPLIAQYSAADPFYESYKMGAILPPVPKEANANSRSLGWRFSQMQTLTDITPTGIPIGNDYSTVDKLYICSMGYVTFDFDYCTEQTPITMPNNVKDYLPRFLAPYWTAFDFHVEFDWSSSKVIANNTASMYFKAIGDPKSDAELSQILKSNNISLGNESKAFVVSWEKMALPNYMLYGNKLYATFQIIIVTNQISETYALFLYKNSNIIIPQYWKNWLNVYSGLKSDFQSMVNVDNFKHFDPQMTKHLLTSTFSTRNLLKQCYDWRDKVTNDASNANNMEIDAIVTICPCTLKQAKLDPRFTSLIKTNIPPLTVCYQWNAFLLNARDVKAYAQCCYETNYGTLLSYQSKSGFELSTTLVKSNENITFVNEQKFCCQNDTELCSQVYGKLRPLPNCDSYFQRMKSGSVYGSLHLQSIFGNMFTILGVGDYKLFELTNGKRWKDGPSLDQLLIQIRCRTNSNNNSVLSEIGLLINSAKIIISLNNGNFSFGDGINTTTQSPSFVIISNDDNIVKLIFPNAPDVFVEITKDNVGQMLSMTVIYFDSYNRAVDGLLVYDRTSDEKLYDPIKNNQIIFVDDIISYAEADSWSIQKDSMNIFNVSNKPVKDANYPNQMINFFINKTIPLDVLINNSFVTLNQSSIVDFVKMCNFTQNNNLFISNYELVSFAYHCLYDALLLDNARAKSVLNFAASYNDLKIKRWNPMYSSMVSTKSLEFITGTPVSYSMITSLTLSDNQQVVRFVPYTIYDDMNFNATSHMLTWTATSQPINENKGVVMLLLINKFNTSSLVLVEMVLNDTEYCDSTGTLSKTFSTKNYAGQKFTLCQCLASYKGRRCRYHVCDLGLTCYSNLARTCAGNVCANLAGFDTLASSSISYFNDVCVTKKDTSVCANGLCNSLHPADITANETFVCACNKNFMWDRLDNKYVKTRCIEVDECFNTSLCNASKFEICKNVGHSDKTPAGFVCDCSSGYTRNLTSNSCERINSCLSNPCGEIGKATCEPKDNSINNESFTCVCNNTSGYFINDKNRCVPKDLCLDPSTNNCQFNCSNELSNNVPPFYTCTCPTNYQLNSDKATCMPTKNCTNTTLFQICNNESGFCADDQCTCQKGRMWNESISKCQSIDYCSMMIAGNRVCNKPNTKCRSLNVGYTCSCNESYYQYIASTESCLEIDECSNATFCPKNAFCTRKENAADICQCNSSFEPVGKECVAKNKCKTPGLCPPDATCVNFSTTYRCKCNNAAFLWDRESNICTRKSKTWALSVKFINAMMTTDLTNSYSVEYGEKGDEVYKFLKAILLWNPIIEIFNFEHGSLIANVLVSYAIDVVPTKTQLESQLTQCLLPSSGLGACQASASDFNECNKNKMDCTPLQNCMNNELGFDCVCKPNVTSKIGVMKDRDQAGLLFEVCNDVNECNDRCRNSTSTSCTNLPATYLCDCANGFVEKVRFNDTGEVLCGSPCEISPSLCQNGGICKFASDVNMTTSFNCLCSGGWRGNFCELEDANYEHMRRIAIIVGVVFGFLFLLMLIIVIIILLKRLWNNRMKEEMYLSNFSENDNINGVMRRRNSSSKYTNMNQMATYREVPVLPRAKINETNIGHQNKAYESNGHAENDNVQSQRNYF